MKNAFTLTALAVAGIALSACATDSYDPGNAAQGGPVNRQATSAAESACMAAVNRNYGGKERSLRIISSEFSQAGSLVMVEANGERWRRLASNDGALEDLSLARRRGAERPRRAWLARGLRDKARHQSPHRRLFAPAGCRAYSRRCDPRAAKRQQNVSGVLTG